MRISSIYTAGLDFRELEKNLPSLSRLGCLPVSEQKLESVITELEEERTDEELEILENSSEDGEIAIIESIEESVEPLFSVEAHLDSEQLENGATDDGLYTPLTDETFEKSLSEIANNQVLYVDTETTGLTPASTQVKARLSVPVNRELRMRILTIGWEYWEPIENEYQFRTIVLDLDKESPIFIFRILDAVLRRWALVGHNLTFDLNWMRHTWKSMSEDANVFPPCPEYAVDTLLLARLLVPEVHTFQGGFALNDLFNDYLQNSTPISGSALSTKTMSSHSADEYLEFADSADNDDDGNLSNAEEAVQGALDKQYQKPVNWIVRDIPEEALEYARMDVQALYDWLRYTCLSSSETSVESWISECVAEPYKTLKGTWPEEYTRKNPLYASNEIEFLENTVQTWLQVPRMLSDWFIRGQPFSEASVNEYKLEQNENFLASVDNIIEVFPELEDYRLPLSNLGKGIKADMRAAIGEALSSTGLRLARTEKTGAFKIGAKDLQGAEITRNPEALKFYKPWKTLNKIKRRVKMAEAYADYARLDGRIHPLFSPATATARLSCSEPNMQQVPSDSDFRAFVNNTGYSKIVASDVSALDVRVGAALSVRLQYALKFGQGLSSRERVEAIIRYNRYGNKRIPAHKLHQLQDILESALARVNSITIPYSLDEMVVQQKDFESKQGTTDFDVYLESRTKLQEMRLSNALWQIRRNLESDNAYSSLRAAFRYGVDIHSWTAAKMQGIDVEKRFQACSTPEEFAEQNHILKTELGDFRKLGKVANLALLYGMGTEGFLLYCKSNWDIHFLPDDTSGMSEDEQWEHAMSEARLLRLQWLDAYPEVELMSLVTEFQNQVYPKYDCIIRKNGKSIERYSPVWMTHTLTGRPITASSKFAALNYPNQGTGSDILMAAVESLRKNYPDTYAMIINQVHDELVLESPIETAAENARLLENAIQESGTKLLGPYGVPMKVETVISDCWQKG